MLFILSSLNGAHAGREYPQLIETVCAILQAKCSFMHNTKREVLRIVLAVAKSGFSSSAGRVLGVNHAAVRRQLAACQDDHNAVIVS
jgi:hypothetical protein